MILMHFVKELFQTHWIVIIALKPRKCRKIYHNAIFLKNRQSKLHLNVRCAVENFIGFFYYNRSGNVGLNETRFLMSHFLRLKSLLYKIEK